MAETSPSKTPVPVKRRDFWILLACLLVIFGVLFFKSFLPEYVLHNNDNPLGANAQAAVKSPEVFSGVWIDLNWLGLEAGTASPDLSSAAFLFFGPVGYAKFWQPLSLLLLGLCGWGFLRSLRFSAFACVLGGLAFALHGDPVSNTCWGQMSRPMSLAMMLLALAALQNGSGVRFWLQALVAGLAVGLGIMEGFDVAALYSVVIGAYTVYQAWVVQDGSTIKKLAMGISRLVLVAGFAALVAAQAITGLVGTQIKGVAGMEQDAKTKAERWAWATQWSLSKVETLGLLVPGLFGYRMDTPEGGQYWGKAGRDLEWDRYFASGKQGPPPQGFLRFGGAGAYSGPVVALLALLALLQSLRKKDSPFSTAEKKFIWFWAGLAFVCLLLAWGRFAPFYKFFYALPYTSTIRSPGKFVHIFDWSILVLVGYGAHALSKRFFENRRGTRLLDKNWWLNAPSFDRKWVVGSILAVGVSLLGWLIYGSSSANLQQYLQEVQFNQATAAAIARFSIAQVGWFVLFLALGAGVLALVMTGRLAGQNAKLGAILLGVVLVADLARANLPWIIYWNHPLKYATNPIIERLKEKPYEHRVVGLPGWILGAFPLSEEVKGGEQFLDQLYRIEWAQHHFLMNNIQSLDVIQMPRPPQDYLAYEGALQQIRSAETLYLLPRRWELTNTRYVLALAGFADFLNRQFDGGRDRFRVVEQFGIVPKPGRQNPTKLEDYTAVSTNNGPFALIEFTGALPRAKLYTNWQTSTNDEATLRLLTDETFNPAETVLVADVLPAPPTIGTNPLVSEVGFVSYAPKNIVLHTKADTATVLLLNDRYQPKWRVRVDGETKPLLRCNYLMRGVQLTPGEHTVEFIFKTTNTALYVSFAGVTLGLLVLGFLLATWSRAESSASHSRRAA